MYIRKKNGKVIKIVTNWDILNEQAQFEQAQREIASQIGYSSTNPGFAAGSLVFGSTGERYIAISQSLVNSPSSSFVIGSGSFTVEWFQNAINLPANSRVFTQGVWPDAEFGVSIEDFAGQTRIFLWLDGAGNVPAIASSGSVTLPYLNTWHHFAVVRASGSYLQIFQDGVALSTITDKTDGYITASISSSLPLIIGGEGDNAALTVFSGSITNFRLTKDALYSQSYTVPTYPLEALTSSVLLLSATSQDTMFVDSSNGGNLILSGSSAVSWSVDSPFWH